LLQPFRPTRAGAIPADERAAGDLYFSAYRTPVVLIYPEQALQPAETPHDWDDLLAPRWKGKVVIRDPIASGTMRAVWGMIIERGIAATGDTAAGFTWLRRLDAQTREYVINETILEQKLLKREGLVSVWDLPDILLNRRDGMPMAYTFPTSGTPVIQDAIGVIRGARHSALAQVFVEWVGSPEAQLLAARQAFRLPARTDIPADSLPSWAREVNQNMKAAPVDWPLLALHQAEWMRYWDEHVRGHGMGNR
jgi:iron(III) transport system substrate-binding protein